MKLTGITFITTYNCNAQCAHCFFDTQTAPHYISPDVVARVYEDVSITKSMFWNHLSGGEVMLQPSKFYAIISEIRKYFTGDLGMSTNAFWAKTLHQAKSVVNDLTQLGISGIAVSSDAFHDAYVPLSYVAHAVSALRDSGLKKHSYIMGARCNSDVFQESLYNSKTDQNASYLQSISNMPLAPTAIRSIGKGTLVNVPKKDTIPCKPCSDLSECLGTRGPFNPAMVWVDAFGNVMVCYGIIIGNVFEKKFVDIISEYTIDSNPVLKIIAEEGPHGLFYDAKQCNSELQQNSFYDTCDVCYACRKALRKKHHMYLGPHECYP